MDNKRFTFSPDSWGTMKLLFEYRCVRCGERETPESPLHADHVIPHSKGGNGSIKNIQPLCSTCNMSKGNRSDIDYRYIFFGKFKDAWDDIQDINYLRSRINIFLSLLFPDFSITREQIDDLIIGWCLKGKQKRVAEQIFTEWAG